MGKPIDYKAFKVSADDAAGRMSLSIVKSEKYVASIDIDRAEASHIAALVLGHARESYAKTGKAPPYRSKEDPVDLAIPSGIGVGPGRKSSTTMLLFHFGDSTLGIELPNSELSLLGQRLMTIGAQGTAQ